MYINCASEFHRGRGPLRLGLGSALQLGLGLVGIGDFRNSGPSE